MSRIRVILESGLGTGSFTDWQPDRQSRSFAGLAVDCNASSMQFDAAFCNHQPKARAADISDVSRALERLEDSREIGCGDSDSAVAYPENNLGIFFLHVEANGAAGG